MHTSVNSVCHISASDYPVAILTVTGLARVYRILTCEFQYFIGGEALVRFLEALGCSDFS
jgi:hypothetical protein